MYIFTSHLLLSLAKYAILYSVWIFIVKQLEKIQSFSSSVQAKRDLGLDFMVKDSVFYTQAGKTRSKNSSAVFQAIGLY